MTCQDHLNLLSILISDINFKNAVIQQVKVQFFKTLDKQSDQIYLSNMPVYAISKARIQYLGASIPLFKFRHSLFEGLICAIHGSEIKPNENSLFDCKLQEPILQEKVLVSKIIEFLNNPFLKPLIELSLENKCVKFVDYFNSLTQTQSPFYSEYRLWFYDIN